MGSILHNMCIFKKQCNSIVSFSFIYVLLVVFDRAILCSLTFATKISVRLSFCHTCDPCLNDASRQCMLCTIPYRMVSVVSSGQISQS